MASALSMGNCKPAGKNNDCVNPRTPTAVSVFKSVDLSSCCDKIIAKELRKLRLSGCAVVSKGLLVIEGEKSSIKSFGKLITRRKFDSRVKLLWQGKVYGPSFGKFSVLRHCGSDFPLRKFFADHEASLYWDLVVKSNWDGINDDARSFV